MEGLKSTSQAYVSLSAHDGIDKIGEGTHGRAVVPWDRFKAMVNVKAAKAGVTGLD